MGIIGYQGFWPVGKLHEVQQFGRPFLGCDPVQPVHTPDEMQVFDAGETVEKAHSFRHDTNLPFHFDSLGSEVQTENLHTSGSGRQQASEHLDRR